MNPDTITPVGLFVIRVPGLDTIGVFTYCSHLSANVDVLSYAEGGNNQFVYQLPGSVSYPHLVLTGGLANAGAMFTWFNASRTTPDRKEVIVIFQDHKHVPLSSFTVIDAFPVSWSGPAAEAGSPKAALQTLVLAHGGVRDI